MDARLRELERAALAAPHDVAASRAFARACEQVGETRRAWLTWCRLARAGDLDSWDVLERRPAGLRRQPEVEAFAALESGLSPLPGTGRRELVLAGRILQAITLDELEPVWSNDLTARNVASLACGPWVVHEQGSMGERRLLVLDAATGLEAARATLVNDNTLTRSTVQLRATADRVVAQLDELRRGRGWTTILDVGERNGEVLADVEPQRRVLDVAGNLLFLEAPYNSREPTSARPSEGGDSRWTTRATILAVDARLALVATPDTSGGLEAPQVTALDTRDGSVRWRAPSIAGHWHPGGEVWLQLNTRGAQSGLSEARGLSRADGRELWKAGYRHAAQRILTVALASDVAYIATEGEGGRRSVTALDLITGEEIFVRGIFPATGTEPVGLVPIENGLVVVTQDRSRTRLERLA